MKAYMISTAIALASMTTAMPAPGAIGLPPRQPRFCQVPIPGNYMATGELVASDIRNSYHGDGASGNTTSWGEHLLRECRKDPGCTSSIGWQGVSFA